MNHFLQNLIDRHQEVEGRGEVSHVVQPRPTSRFEMNAGPAFYAQQDINTGADFTTVTQSDLEDGSDSTQSAQIQHDQETSPIKTADSRQPSRPVQDPVHQRPKKPTTQPFLKDQSPDLNEQLYQIKNVIQQPEQKTFEWTPSRNVADNEDDKRTDSPQKFFNRTTQFSDEFSERLQTTRQHLSNQPSHYAKGRNTNESTPKSVSNVDDKILAKETNQHIQIITEGLQHSQPPHHSDAQRFIESSHEPEIAAETENNSSTAEINQRIQSILYRLNGQQPQQANSYAVNESLRESTAKADHNAPTDSAALLRIADQASVLLQPAVPLKEKNVERESEQHETRQSGLMQIPSWLTEMQADLNQRWQELNNKAQPESVINVTIGRVDVKAVQAEPLKKPKARNKPSGVMNLDDYLKQRENRGRR